MKYNISKSTAPAMPALGKGTECIKLLLTQASKVMHEPLVPMFFPVLGAHISGAEFQYPDRSWKETCGMMANIVAETGGNKGQLSTLVEAICRDFREHVPQVSELAQGCTGRDGCFAPCPDAAAQGSKVRGRGLLYRAAGKIPMIFRKPPAMSTKDRQRPLRMQYLCTIKKTTAYKGPDNGVGTPKQRRCFRGEKPPLPKMAAQQKTNVKMSKIIYRKVLHLRVETRVTTIKQLLGPLQASPSRGGMGMEGA